MDKANKLTLIRSLFNSRKDVFAIHWQKPALSGGNKSGYMPAYHYDPYRYRLHKIKGGSFKDYKDKTHLPLTDQQIIKHLEGEQLIGIYPLLQDNTSWFIAADFDKQNWKEACRKFIEICGQYGVPAYLERSRSGRGGHVWVFFEHAYPAIKSRKIITTLLEMAGIISVFDKNSSFDRLFPNQDFLSGKGLGNLIALPFHKPAFEQGNSCFVDPSTDELDPYSDQWKFLATIQKISVNQLDKLYQSLAPNADDISQTQNNPGKLQISLSHDVRLNRWGLTQKMVNFLKDELHFANSAFFVKKKSGKNTWGTPRYFNCIEETEKEVIVPRGFIGRLLRHCKQQKIEVEFLDKRKKQKPVNFTDNIILRPHQQVAIEAASQKDFGIISAPPGSGKTVIGLHIIADKQQPALIIVHRKQLLEQWVESIQAFLGIPKKEN